MVTWNDGAVSTTAEVGIASRLTGGQLRDAYVETLPAVTFIDGEGSTEEVHQLFTRLYLLRLRGREPAPGPPAGPRDRSRAAMIDVAFCFTLAGFIGRRRRRLRRTLVIAAAYHVACWSISGRTLGGLVMRQRVVAVDGSRLTPAQAIFRLALLPAYWITRRPMQDELASTEVITD